MAELQSKMQELSPSNDETKTVFMRAVLLALYSVPETEIHSKNCRLIIINYIKWECQDLDAMFDSHFEKRSKEGRAVLDLYKKENVSIFDMLKFVNLKHLCVYSGYIAWICLYVIVVSVFFLCFGYSENRMDSFLWNFYIILYVMLLLFSLCIMLLHYMDPMVRMKKHFGWLRKFNWKHFDMSVFISNFERIWYTAEAYLFFEEMFEQSWMARMIAEFVEFGNIDTWQPTLIHCKTRCDFEVEWVYTAND